MTPGPLVLTHPDNRSGLSGPPRVVVVSEVKSLSIQRPVYNIEVAGEHVYEVTLLGILVHNTGSFDCKRYYDLLVKDRDNLKMTPGGLRHTGDSARLRQRPVIWSDG
jgi:hypothetical protein